MINVFFDCEFTKLQLPNDPEPNELISIGCISEDGKRFYAENATVICRPKIFSDFVTEVVVPLLEGGDCEMPYADIAKHLKAWIESFNDEVKMWSDAPYFDWQHVKHMFDNFGWPANLKREPVPLSFASSIQSTRFFNAVENMFMSNKQLRRHHALDDAIANRHAFKLATMRNY